jgi:hypothetical protein
MRSNNADDNEMKWLEQRLTDELSQYPMPEELPTGFVNKVRQKIRIRQRQIFVQRMFALSGVAAMLLIGLSITWFLLRETKPVPQIKLIPSQVQIDEFEARLAQVTIPSGTAGRIQVLSQLIGTDTFTLSVDRKKDVFAFISDQEPKNLKNNRNSWEVKLQKVFDKCFPQAQIMACILENGNCKEFGVVE